MIRYASGNLLRADAEALVNTVNTVGVMGKGIALQFKRAYPDMFTEYARAAKAGLVEPGHMHVWETHALTGPRLIINFPTKRHWRSPSNLDDIKAGLIDLERVILVHHVQSIALPPLGCGNGGLAWDVVRPAIETALGSLPTEVIVFAPSGAPAAADMVDTRAKPPMTPGRAALLRMMRAYRDTTAEAPSLIEIQKLMYFLQQQGQPLKLRYERGRYGPYADNLRHVLAQLEGHYISGFGDGSATVREAEPLELINDGGNAASELLANDSELSTRVEHVMDLASGWESPYGLELLASVLWVAENDPTVRDSITATTSVREWSARKERLFTERHVRLAWEHLDERGWLSRKLTSA